MVLENKGPSLPIMAPHKTAANEFCKPPSKSVIAELATLLQLVENAIL